MADKGGVVRCSGFCDLKGFVSDTRGHTLIMMFKNVVICHSFSSTLVSVRKAAETDGVSILSHKSKGHFKFSGHTTLLPVVLMVCIIYISM
jgi:hypothetical protein